MSPVILLLIGLTVVLAGILWLKLHPVIALLTGALAVGALTSQTLLERYAQSKGLSEKQTSALVDQSLGERVAIGFGNTCEKVGLLIMLASIIGKGLLDSGAAERIVRSMLAVFGSKKAPWAFMVSSFGLAIPIFFDTVFYLMIPLARAMGVRFQKSYALFVMAIVAGGTIAHSLVPPTPGPLFAAGAFGVSIGMMIIVGTIIGFACSTAGLLYAFWLNKRQDIAVRTTADTTLEGLQSWLDKDTSQLPSFFMANLPIVLPVVLIAGDTIISNVSVSVPPAIKSFFSFAGDPNVALFLAMIIALVLLAKQYSFKLKQLKKPIEDAVLSAGTIILITSTGGAFGHILQQTSIGSWIADEASGYQYAILPLAFFITAVIRTAQGSATVAMITAVGMLTVFNTEGALNFHPVYLAVVIGCGSKIFPWMNDSGFWIICKMSGFTERETIRNFSYLLLLMGMTGLIVTMIMAKLFPLV
ncbi:MAG TPA: GntP family permease [Chryseolinea sp.]|nr:GntP family permease [Chryseolinea sp.]